MDLNENRDGEKRGKLGFVIIRPFFKCTHSFFSGQLTANEIAAVVVGAIAMLGAAGVSLFFCYCIASKHRQNSQQKYGGQ